MQENDLRRQLDLLMGACTVKFHSAITEYGREQMYAFRCVQAEYSMRFSEPFLESCVSIAKRKSEGFWIEYFERHLEEERGHHVWAREDLDVVNSSLAHRWSISPHLQKLLKYQQLRIESGDIFSQIGYCICVESYQGTREYWKAYCASTSLPESAFRNALRHSVLDIEHAAELWKLFGELEPHQQRIAEDSAVFTATSQLNMFTDLLACQIQS